MWYNTLCYSLLCEIGWASNNQLQHIHLWSVIADHVLRTISEVTIRPVVVMACVNQQQQPIETIDRKIVQVTSIRQQKDLQPSLSSLSNEAIAYNSVAIRGISSTYKIQDCIAKSAWWGTRRSCCLQCSWTIGRADIKSNFGPSGSNIVNCVQISYQ